MVLELLLLCGCSSQNPYQQRGGVWYFEKNPIKLATGERLTPLKGVFAKTQIHGYFRGLPITDSEGSSFEVLSEHYAKDAKGVYYCDAYRDGQDYFSVLHIRTKRLGADPQTFQYLKSGYARDASRVFFEGAVFPVKDVASFEVLDYAFTRDSIMAYYHQTPIAGSDGKNFKRLDGSYSTDGKQVFYSYIDLEAKPMPRSFVVRGALVGSFEVLNDYYAKDAGHLYYAGKAMATGSALEVMGLGYAKTSTQVFYEGKVIAGADAGSFVLLSSASISETQDAKDSKATYRQGRKTGP